MPILFFTFALILFIILVDRNLLYTSHQTPKLFALHNNKVILLSLNFRPDEVARDDMGIFGYSSSSIDVISGNHSHSNTSFFAIKYSLGYRLFEWIFDTSYTQYN